MRAAVYARQSLNVQEGIERQLDRCTKMAGQKGWTVVRTYKDNDTSATKTRGAGTAWARMLSEAGSFDVLIAVDLDRLLRTTRDLVTLIEAGVKVVTVDGELDLSTADGEFRATMMAGIARFEVKRKSERQKRADDARAAKGQPMMGRRPFGWEPDQITLRESEAHWLAWMHERLIAGDTLYSIVRRLNSEGVTTARGQQWTTAQVRAVLKRERNAGLFIRNGVVQDVSLIQPAVPLEDHQTVLGILNGRPFKPGPKTGDNWLSGIMTCECGGPMIQKAVRSKGTRTRTYQCRANTVGTAGPGNHVSIAAHIAEDAVSKAVLEAIADGTLKAPEADAEGLREVQAELASIGAQRAAATDALLVPGVDTSRITKRLRELATAAEQLEQKRTDLVAQSAHGGALADFIEFMSQEHESVAAAYGLHMGYTAWGAMDPEKRRAIIRSAVKVSVNAGGKGAKRMRIAFI